MEHAVTLGAFHLLAPIARGGMGEVWLGRHAERDQGVAIKLMTAPQLARPQGRRAFRNEVRAVAALDHPAIVTVYDHGELDEAAARQSGGRLAAGTPYLVMELIRGGSLRGAQPGGWSGLRGALLDLLGALAHAHARGVIHRDLKPGNVLVASPDEPGAAVRISDFGLAAPVLDPTLPLQSRTIVGTLQYMAPEQVTGRLRDVGPWTDLYSLGCVAWRMATGARAFEANDTRELIAMQVHEPPPPFDPAMSVPEGLEAWLLRLLHKDPARRYLRAADAAWGLLQLGDAAPEPDRPIAFVPAESSGAYRRLSGGRSLSWTGWTTIAPPPQGPSLGSLDPSADTDELGAQDLRSERGHTPTIDPLPAPPTDWRVLEPRREESTVGPGLGLLGLRTTAFVGRGGERDRLWAALRAVIQERRPRAVMVSGPEGIGRSRLIQWLCETAHEAGHVTVLKATHCALPSAHDGLGPMAGASLGATGLNPADATARIDEQLAPYRGITVHERASLLRLIGADRTDGAPAERRAAITGLVRRSALRRPTVVWLDDVHWDRDSVAFARALLEEIDLPVLVLCSVAEDAARPLATRGDLETLASAAGAEQIALGPLPHADQRVLVRGLLGLAPDLADAVLRRTDGHPLFTVDLLQDWMRRGLLLAGPAGYAMPDGALPMPASVGSLHAAQLERWTRGFGDASAQIRQALELAAALGRSVLETELDAACRVAGVELPTDAIERAVAAGIAAPATGGWRFSHPAWRDAVEASARAGSRWEQAHGAVLAALDSALDASHPESAERLARHGLAAGELERALVWLEDAARALRERGDYGRGAALLAEHAEHRSRAGLSEDGERALAARAIGARISASRGRFVEAATEVEALAEAARRVGSAEILAESLRQRGFLAWQRSLHQEARAAYEEALSLDRLRGDGVNAARCLLGLGVVGLRGDGDSAGAKATFTEALGMFAHLDDSRGVIDALGWLAIVARRGGDYGGARDLQREALAAARRIGHRFGELMALNSIGDASRLLGDRGEAERCYREALAIARATGSGEAVWPQLNLGLTLLDLARYAEAEDLLERSLLALQRMERTAFVGCVHAALVPCAAARGDWPGGLAHLEQAEALLAGTGMVDADVAWPLERASELAGLAGESGLAARAAALAEAQRSALADTMAR